MRTRIIALCCLVGWSMFFSLLAREQLNASSDNIRSSFFIAKPPDGAYQAALTGKLILEQLVSNDKQLVHALGFRSADEATDANMSVGTPMAVLPVNADALRNYTPPGSIGDLVK